MEYGLIGNPLKHSFSKFIHERIAFYEKNNSYKYELNEIKEEDLDSFLIKKDFKAINVTIPYKEKVIPYLDYISPQASNIHAVNVVVNKDNKLYGYNTDFYGLLSLIQNENINVSNKKVLILGTGGTSKTAYEVVKSLNAKEIKKSSRKNSNEYLSYDEAYETYNDCEIIINTTPCGMYPNNGGSAIDINKFNNLEALIDVIYNPLSTKLVLDAKEKNIKAVGGLYMLVSQAVYAYYLFNNLGIDNINRINELTRILYKELLNEKLNICLIGMPSCGKTSIGTYLSKLLNKELIDTDDEIKKIIKMEIKDYFFKFGEASFREVEKEVIKEISKKSNVIISTGGGVILNKSNIDNLKENSKIYFINRDLDKLITTDDRPLSKDIISLKKRYNERYDLYCMYANKIIDGNGNISEVSKLIMEDYYD